MALRKGEDILRRVFEGLPIPAFVIDMAHCVILWNHALEVLSGITADRVIGRRQHWNAFYNEKRPCMADFLVDGEADSLFVWYGESCQKSSFIDEAYEATSFFPDIGEDGKWIHFTAAIIRNQEGAILGVIETLEDITDRKSIEQALRESELSLKEVLHGSPIPTFVIDRNHIVTYWNRALENMTGYAESTIKGTSEHWRAFYNKRRPCMADLIVDEKTAHVPVWYAEKYRLSNITTESFEGRDFFPDLGDNGKWLRFTATALRNSEALLIGAVETLEDITDQKLAEEALIESEKRYRRLSITDALTKLFNSRHFYNQLRKEIERAARYGHALSLLLLDIDDFKDFNDRFGHLEGDTVLVRIGEVMLSSLRKTDTAYRFGGEEFTAVLPETDGAAAAAIAERIREDFEAQKFCPRDDERVSKTVSIGIAEYQSQDTITSLILRADQAMYHAKAQGKNRIYRLR